MPKTRAPNKKVDISEFKDVCPVPIINCMGKANESEQDVRMYCSNKECQVSLIKIHSNCFSALVESLVKSLKGSGRSRRWTETQCRQNLWSSHCDFLRKTLKCPCGTGLLHVNIDLTPRVDSPRNEAKTKSQRKQHPKLVFSSNMSTKKDRKKIKKLDFNFLTIHSDDETLAEPNPKGKIQVVKPRPKTPSDNVDTTPRRLSWLDNEDNDEIARSIKAAMNKIIARSSNGSKKSETEWPSVRHTYQTIRGSVSTSCVTPSLTESNSESDRTSVSEESIKHSASEDFYLYITKLVPTALKLDSSSNDQSKWDL